MPRRDDVAPAIQESIGQLARRLARTQRVGRRPGRPRRFRRRLRRVERSLVAVHREFHASAELREAYPRTAEWLLDNEYLTRGALRHVAETLTPGFLLDLPKLQEGTGDDPRIRVLAGHVVDHARAELEIDDLARFVGAYQEIADLAIGELWALPAMLQLALLEEMAAVVGPLTASAPAPSPEPGAEPARRVAACIESLRLAAGHDWRLFVERVSRVERLLRHDPAGAYARMEFESRDRYRRAVEEIARDAGGHEAEVRVARAAVERSRSLHGSADRRARHVGFHLIDEGREALERAVGCRPGWRIRRRRRVRRHARSVYFGLVGLIGVGALTILVAFAAAQGTGPGALLLVLAAGLVPSVTMAVSVTNWIAAHTVPPRLLPKLELEGRVPDEFPTVVALPVLMGDEEELGALLAHLEVLRHASPLEGLVFVLLTDLPDAPRREMPGDRALVEAARRGVRQLNERYREADREGPFCLLHRDRHWNPAEGCWMGWERKRGKLEELNRFLLGAEDTGFTVREGDLERLRGTRFVITLDADTVLPPEAAGRLIGTLAHPLQRPETTAEGRIAAGYTVLQPRLDTAPRSGRGTIFARLGEGESGLDLYSHASSDVYQDLFGEGLYAGKGIYDVRAFHQSLRDRVPENAILSHDLFEGIHGRAGLVSDVRLFEEYPSHVASYLRRSHRWIRGDWQLLPWLLPRVPASGGERVPNRFDLLDRWKILDNLRRSLLAPSLLALLLIGWLGATGSAWLWFGAIGGVYALPVFLGAAGAARRFVRRSAPRRGGRRGPIGGVLRKGVLGAARATTTWLLAIALLPQEALVACDAIGRTLFRLAVTRRHLLEWTSAAHAARRIGAANRATTLWRFLWQGPAVGAVTGASALWSAPQSLPAILPVAAAWLLSPGIASLVSRPLPVRKRTLSTAGRRRLRITALRTWLYFERLLDSEDHWLPPDNYREGPEGRVARRTSPTNIGMMLGATMAAYDLGFIDVLMLEATLGNVLESMGRLERHRGHFLNWYSTADLRPLEPRYVSTVDSGNLAAALIAVSRGLAEVPGRRLLGPTQAEGLEDALEAMAEVVRGLPSEETRGAVAALEEKLEAAVERVRGAADDPVRLSAALAELEERCLPALDEGVLALGDAAGAGIGERRLLELRTLSRKVRQQVATLRRVETRLLPWLALLRDSRVAPEPSPTARSEGSARRTLWALLSGPLTLEAVPRIVERARELLARLETEPAAAEGSPVEAEPLPPGAERAESWNGRLRGALSTAEDEASRVRVGLATAREEMEWMVEGMDFRFLFDPERELFHIGFDVTSEEVDPHHYDLLASEARIASLLAIARGDVPVSHWLRLGRPFGRVGGSRVLLSWGATMFEYLLPTLFARTPEDSLLGHACRQAVRRQIAFAKRRGIPWGVSESAYHGLGADVDYPYRAFGIPALGLRRDLGERLVVAPYASLLALPLAPRSVERNLERLRRLGLLGPLGLYEAVDFGVPAAEGPRRARVVRAYMAHHQGMILMSVDNHLNGNALVERFHADPRVAAVEHLVHERLPWQVPARRSWARPARAARPPSPRPTLLEWEVPEASHRPDVHLLSNGRYALLLTARGGGGSRWGDVALTRWRPDPTLERRGSWVYVGDPESGELWSATREPTARRPDSSSVRFAPHMAEFHRRDAGIFVRTRVVVAADDDVEIREVSVTNESDRRRRVALASYGEVVLGSEAEDRRHPAYAKLFVESEHLEERRTLLFRRRARAADERPAHLGHALVTGGMLAGKVSWETDREAFLGRRGDVNRPLALRDGRPRLSGRVGATLDPIFSLACELELAPYESAEVVFVTAAGSSRAEVLAALDRYRSPHRCAQAVEWARERASLLFDETGIPPSRAPTLQRLLSALVHPHPALGGRAAELAGESPSRAGLWKHGISGDHPILLVGVTEPEESPLVERLLRAHAYRRRQNAPLHDLVLLDRGASGYAQPLRDRLRGLLEETGSGTWLGRAGGVHLLGRDRLEEAELRLLESAARVVIDAGDGSLSRRLERGRSLPAELPEFVPVPSAPPSEEPTPALPPSPLGLKNGFGGFSQNGREYVIRLEPGASTPAPWANVVSSPDFGFLVTESGGGFTWASNSAENRLTPWRNDPVTDLPSEVLYLRDEETGEVWSVTPAPAGGEEACEVRHGAGHSSFRRRGHGLEQELTLFCAREDPVKILRLRLADLWRRQRRVTVTFYAEWVLGSTREASAPHVAVGYDSGTDALLARNAFRDEFGSRVAFVAASHPPHGLTADRTEFLGRDGDPSRPAGLWRIGLSGRVEPTGDPCAAYQVHLDIPPGEETEVHFLIGQGTSREDALELVRRYREPEAVGRALEEVERFWDGLLGALTVETPEAALDHMVNRWLLYQAVSSRLWGRTGLYQSSGAFGFRDQLQDVLALVHAAPGLAREHILEAAGRQFEEGDVLHWWQPGTATGVRTRCSDDLLWLPYVTALYVERTGDRDILREEAAFLRGEALREGEDERYGSYETGWGTASLYEHCVRAIERGTTRGARGLPLIGSGDWNDGLDRVGREGRGESVWLAWFLAAVLDAFAPLCEEQGELHRAAEYRRRAAELRGRVDETAWDGEWYHRAYYDDGTPLGSAESEEARIDAISQAWSVLTGGEGDRSRRAMRSVAEHLIRQEERLVLLLAPPFDRTDRDPGYIKGYPPGVRENGGQYTHAAAWVGWAFAELGDAESAGRVLRFLNPALRATDPEEALRYRVEPYVVAADVYGAPPHVGRGGWTWYTGSAAWLYRLATEVVLGLRREGDVLHVEPRLPPEWSGYRAELRVGSARYRIEVRRDEDLDPAAAPVLRVDGEDLGRGPVPLRDDGGVHEVGVRLAAREGAPAG